jgi:hypothetical protein
MYIPGEAAVRTQEGQVRPAASQLAPRHTPTFCAPHAHPLLPTAMACVSYGFVLVRVCVEVGKCAAYEPSPVESCLGIT